MSAEALTVASLRDEHLADLRALDRDPRHLILPMRRGLFVRLGLIAAAEPPRSPRPEGGWSARAPRPRAYRLTEAGMRAIGVGA